MMVRTKADELIDEVKENLSKAKECLDEAIKVNTDGRDQFKEEYIDKLHKYAYKIDKMLSRL